MVEKILTVSNWSVGYGSKSIVNHVSFEIHSGEIVGLVGESGSGKSTLIRSLIGLLGKNGCILSGETIFNGKQLKNLSKKEWNQIHGKDISLIFQLPQASLDPLETINKQYIECVKCHNPKKDKSQIIKEAQVSLKSLHFDNPDEVLDSYPFELSGGMCQRAAIALAVANHPMLLFADEPTSALDVTSQEETLDTFLELREKFGMSILLVTHNMSVIAKVADTVGVMYQGNLVEWGKKEEILHSPKHGYTKALLDAIPKFGKQYSERILYKNQSTENEKKIYLSDNHWFLGKEESRVNGDSN